MPESTEGVSEGQTTAMDFKSTNEYYMPHAMVVMKNAAVYLSPEYYRSAKKEYVLVDIFPLDNVPDSAEEQRKQKVELKRLSKIQSREECILYKRNSLFEIAAKKVIQSGLKLIYPIRKVNVDQLAQFLRIFDDRQLCLHAKPIRDTTDLLCSTVWNCAQFFVIVKRDGIDNDVVMYMSFINMSCYYKLIFSFCEFQR